MLRASQLALLFATAALLPGCFILFHDPEGAGGQGTGGLGGTATAGPGQTGISASGSDVSAGSADVVASASVGSGGGTIGSAVQLDGTKGYVGFPMTGAYTPTDGFTWELWFRPDAVPTDPAMGRAQTLFGVMDGAPCEDIYLGFGSEKTPKNLLTFVVDRQGDCSTRDDNPARGVPTPDGFVAGHWYHVAAVADYTAGKTALYVDGQLVGQGTRIGTGVSRPGMTVEAGRWNDATNHIQAYFPGSIDELRIYGVALSSATIVAHYDLGAGTYGLAADPDLLAGWHFDEAMGGMANPFAGNAPGSLSGGVSWVLGKVAHP